VQKPDDGHFWLKHVVSLIEYNIFITKLCYLTTLTPLISYTHNGDDTHKSSDNISQQNKLHTVQLHTILSFCVDWNVRLHMDWSRLSIRENHKNNLTAQHIQYCLITIQTQWCLEHYSSDYKTCRNTAQQITKRFNKKFEVFTAVLIKQSVSPATWPWAHWYINLHTITDDRNHQDV